MTEKANDNCVPLRTDRTIGPDLHGQAAMLLVESLIHGLIARSVISVEDAVEIVETAAEVKAAIGGDLGDSAEALQKSLRLLTAISDSLGLDVKDRRGQ